MALGLKFSLHFNQIKIEYFITTIKRMNIP